MNFSKKLKSSIKDYNFLFKLLLSSVITFFFLPKILINQPTHGLDASWSIAIQWALEKNLLFGRDVVFPYGPLGFFVTRLLIGGVSKWHYLFFDLFILSNIFFLTFYALTKYFHWVTFFVLLIISLLIRDIFDYTVVFVLYYFLLFYYFLYLKESNKIFLFLSFFLAVFLFFIKSNIGLIALFSYIIFIGYAYYSRRIHLYLFSSLVIAFFLVVNLSSWFLHVDLINYTISSIHLINSYNDAMFAVPPGFFPLYFGLAVMNIYLLFFILSLSQLKNSKDLLSNLDWYFMYFLIFTLLFVLHKQTFTRNFNTYNYFEYLPLVLLLLIVSSDFILSGNNSLNKDFLKILLMIVVGTSIMMTNVSSGFFIRIKKNNFIEDKYNGFRAYVRQLKDFNLKLDKSNLIQTHPQEIYDLIGKNTVDIIPADISHLYLKDLNYQPRPVIQSYAAFDSYLDDLNYKRYLSSKAPEYITMEIYSIDDRFAFFDESKTKLAILQNYAVEKRYYNYVLLKRNKSTKKLTAINSVKAVSRTWEDISIPATNYLQLTQIKVQYSLLGSIRRFFFQPPPLYIVIKNHLGVEGRYRVSPEILSGGVFLNISIPNINSTNINSSPQGNSEELEQFMKFHGTQNKKNISFRLETDLNVNGFSPSFEITTNQYLIE